MKRTSRLLYVQEVLGLSPSETTKSSSFKLLRIKASAIHQYKNVNVLSLIPHDGHDRISNAAQVQKDINVKLNHYIFSIVIFM